MSPLKYSRYLCELLNEKRRVVGILFPQTCHMYIITCILKYYYIIWCYKNRSTSIPSTLFEGSFQFLICVRVCVWYIWQKYVMNIIFGYFVFSAYAYNNMCWIVEYKFNDCKQRWWRYKKYTQLYIIYILYCDL